MSMILIERAVVKELLSLHDAKVDVAAPWDTAFKALREALAQQPAQEPLLAAIRAEPTEMIYKWRVLDLVKGHTPQPAQEPFGYWFSDDPTVVPYPGSGFHRGKEPPTSTHAITVTPLYTAPPAPQPPTDEQIDAALLVWCGGDILESLRPLYRDSFRKAIAAAHGIGANK